MATIDDVICEPFINEEGILCFVVSNDIYWVKPDSAGKEE